MQVIELLSRPRYEVLPLASLDDQLAAIPLDVAVTVTCSPSRGIGETLEATARLRALGARVVPHIAARQVVDRDHLGQIVATLRGLGIEDIFVPGGDMPEPRGDFSSALQLLTALDQLDHGFARIGVAAYPEGHPKIPDDVLARALADKSQLASYMVTQLCFAPDRVAGWLRSTRAAGVSLDLHVGVPGVIDKKRLLKTSLKIGVGESLRFLRKQNGIGRLVGFGTYYPDHLVDEIAGALAFDAGFRGLHIYTFNQVTTTEAWRRERLGSIPSIEAQGHSL